MQIDENGENHARLSDFYPGYYGIANLHKFIDAAPTAVWRQLARAKDIADQVDDDVTEAVGNAWQRLLSRMGPLKGM